MFGSAFGTSTAGQQTGSSVFGAPATGQNQQTGGGLFGSLGQNNQQSQQQGTGLFGGLGLGQNTQNQQQPGGLGFGQNTQQQSQPQQTSGLFSGLGQNNQQQSQPQQGTGLFSGLGQNNQQQQQQTGSVFNPQQSLGQSQQNQYNNSLWQPNSGISPRKFLESPSVFHTNIGKVKRAFPIKSRPFSINGILAIRIALSNTTSTTKYLLILKNTSDLARMKTPRNGRMRSS
jgi:hypothetical protein